MARRGRRPTPLEDPRVQALLMAIKGGNYLEHACAFAGIARSTLYDWLERGRTAREKIDKGQPLTMEERHYLDLSDTIEKARGEAVVANVTIVQKAAREGTWQAAAWWLERTMPEQFGRHIKAEVKTSDANADLEAELARYIAILDQVDSGEQISLAERPSEN